MLLGRLAVGELKVRIRVRKAFLRGLLLGLFTGLFLGLDRGVEVPLFLDGLLVSMAPRHSLSKGSISLSQSESELIM